MPWTYDKPPDVAKNWTDEEIRKCVDAANAVMEESGDDQEAIFACIHAAGKSKEQKSMETEIRAWKPCGAADLPLADRGMAWDASAAEQHVRKWAGGPDKEGMDWAKYRQAFFAYDSEHGEEFTGYKLQFADIVNGQLRAVPRGIFAVAAVLMGSRGGVDLPGEVQDAIKGKVAAYYHKIEDGLKAPWEEEKKSATPMRVGRVLSEKNRQLIQNAIQQSKEAIEALQELLDSTALTEQQRSAIYSELRSVRIVADNRVGGYGVLWGNKQERDVYNTYFTPETDFWDDKLPVRQVVLYDHGFDPKFGTQVLGHVDATRDDEIGRWIEAQLELSEQWLEAIRELAKQNKLAWSSGAVSHLVDVAPDGAVRSWPVVEYSMTPAPAEPRMLLNDEQLMNLTKFAPAIQALIGAAGKAAPEAASQVAEQAVAGADMNDTKSTEGDIQMDENKVEVKELDLDAVAEKVVEKLAAEPAVKKAGFATPNIIIPSDEITPVKAFDAWLHGGHRISPAIRAALQEGTDSEGGYIVPTEYAKELVKALYDESVIRQAGARVIPMNSDSMKVPTLTASSAAILTAEEAAYSEVEPTFGEVDFNAYKYTRLAKASDELVADSTFPLWEAVLQPDFVQAFAAAENSAFTTGTGSSQPQGVVTGATTGVTAASASAITANEVIDLYHALNYKYRPKAVWMANDATIKAIRQLKDSYGQYMWQPGLANGEPPSLLGRPIITNNSMATIAASAKVLLFGDFSYYWIGEREGLTIKRLEELYAANGQIGFRAYKRFDGNVMLAAAFQLLVMASA